MGADAKAQERCQYHDTDKISNMSGGCERRFTSQFGGNLETTETYEHKFPNQDNFLLQRKQKAKQERKHYRNGSAVAVIYLVSTIKH